MSPFILTQFSHLQETAGQVNSVYIHIMLINGQGGNSKDGHKSIITSVQSNQVVNFMYPFYTISSGNTDSVDILKY